MRMRTHQHLKNKLSLTFAGAWRSASQATPVGMYQLAYYINMLDCVGDLQKRLIPSTADLGFGGFDTVGPFYTFLRMAIKMAATRSTRADTF